MTQGKRSEYSTNEVATILRVPKQTLLNWLRSGKLPEPHRVPVGRGEIKARIWTPEDLRRAFDVKGSVQRGRPRKRRPTEEGKRADKRLLELDRLLSWYSNKVKLADEERAAFYVLQGRLRDRLAEAGLEW